MTGKKIARLAASYEWCTGVYLFMITMDIADLMIVASGYSANYRRKKTDTIVGS